MKIKFEKLSEFGNIMGKSIVAPFSDSRGQWQWFFCITLYAVLVVETDVQQHFEAHPSTWSL